MLRSGVVATRHLAKVKLRVRFSSTGLLPQYWPGLLSQRRITERCRFESCLGCVKKTRKMVVYYDGLSDEEESAIADAVVNIICPEKHNHNLEECRLQAILWRTLK